MAQRRMFSMRVVGQDDFLDMPLSTQALYFHLGMYADDDGFVNPGKVIRMSGANADDLKILGAKKFVVPFKSGVIVVRHWKENNYIQKDRYQKTLYGDEMAQLGQDKDGVYILDTQDRLELGKDSNISTARSPKKVDVEGFEMFWSAYPRKIAKENARKSWARISPDATLRETIVAALEVHKASSQWVRDDGKYIPHPATWLNQKRWEDEIRESGKVLVGATVIKE